MSTIGFIISDQQGIHRITSPPHANYSCSVQTRVHVGIDMVMVPYNSWELIDDLTFQVKNIIPMSRIDNALKRILRLKFQVGLFENPLADTSLDDQLRSKEHRELAREAVRKSLVLLKNSASANELALLLPKKAPRILVAGSHAVNLGYQCGGWTIQWYGLSGNNLIEARLWLVDRGINNEMTNNLAKLIGTTILTAIKDTIDPKTEVYAETFGDSQNLTTANSSYDTIQNVCRALKCIVVVIFSRPEAIEPSLAQMDVLMAAWLPGTKGQGLTVSLMFCLAITVLQGNFPGLSSRLSISFL
ncbi:hypothetical protein Cgig2_019122 [Carnegiea gigantea]|uniref:Uncharacterized protein n=1 Tax=Carnegiea gigantea TaxID=171969 RepID=A0A9Q1GSB5_9CARY|nr:hypothetical protein Cgig2_019122 [Carnegiea gigantea]